VKIDQNKLRELVTRDLALYSSAALRREGNVFFVGGNLPELETLETLFESHYQSNAALFYLTFGDIDDFQNGEKLARMIKKNFNARLMGRLDCNAPPHLIERAYAAGIDIIDLPPTAFHRDKVSDGRSGADSLPRAIDCARSVFPRWSVVSTLVAGEEPAGSTMAGIDLLLANEVVPLVALSKRAARLTAEETCQIYTHLNGTWRSHKAAIKPLLPLINLTTPLVPAQSRGALRGFIDLIDDRRLLATSDLRRVLRVKEVEESYASSGL